MADPGIENEGVRLQDIFKFTDSGLNFPARG